MIESCVEFIHFCAGSFHLLIDWLVEVIGAFGYPGVVALMFLESSFFPFPSEVVIPPAGYLASQGSMNIFAVVLCGTAGSLLGALFNYFIALKWGRRLFDKYGKYFFISGETLDKADAFFEKHGHISTFTSRLLPVIRQYVSLPAGLARMNLPKFCAYTVLGSGIWVSVLAAIGYCVGAGGDGMHSVLKRVTLMLILFCVLIVALYMYKLKKGGREN
ncbi:membrane protein [Synergistales bacterium]|nr:membrane protein [Synergistales bacterium]